jgi:hypothetical protein
MIPFHETKRAENLTHCYSYATVNQYFLTYEQRQHCEDDVEQI